MIKRLQRRFVLIVAASLLIVETIIIGVINILNFSQIGDKEDQLLTIISDNGGSFPEFGIGRRDQGLDKPSDKPDSSPEPPEEERSMEPPTKDGKSSWKYSINVETRYQTRFFSVTYDSALCPSKIDTGHIAAVSSEEALEYAEEADGTKKTVGYIDYYKFKVAETEDGGRLFVFLDCRDDIYTKNRFLLLSVGISLVGYVLVCLLVAVVSKRAVKPFAESYEKQRMFINDAAHELKTPLAIISANTEVIEMLGEPTEWTESIRNQTKRLDGLIANLLKLARMDEKGQKKVFQEFDLTEAFEDTARPFVTLAETRGLGLTIKNTEGIRLSGDEAGIRQLISVLTENAVKYCDEGGAIEAELSRSQSGRHAFIRVTNDCKDPPSEPDRLFDRFYRDDKSRMRQDGEVRTGYGIGLSVAKAVCEEHKGRISCRTGQGKIVFEARLRCN